MTAVDRTGQPAHAYRLRLAALSLAMLLPSLGTSIANVALPTLADAFRTPLQNVQWVVISYLLAVTSLIVGAGRLGDVLGRRRVLLFGIGVFTVASACAAFAGSLWLLIGLRAVQGLGAAVMMSLTIASVSDMVPKDRTGSAMGLLGTVSAVGTAMGPSLGGLLINGFGWPAVFGFMALAGAAAYLLGAWAFPADLAAGRKRFGFDFGGMVILALSLGAYALSTTLGGPSPGLTNGVLALLALAGLAAFVQVEKAAAEPLVQLDLLRAHGLKAGLVAMALVSAIMMATLVVGPFYLSRVLGLGPLGTGLTMSVGPVISALTGIPSGRLVDRLGAPAVTRAGLFGVLGGSVLMTILPGAFGVAGYVGGLVFVTSGYALFQTGNNTAIMNGAAKERRGVISALLGLARNLGLVTGASAMGAVFTLGSKAGVIPGLGQGGEAGLRLTFAVAAILAALALAAAVAGRRRT